MWEKKSHKWLATLGAQRRKKKVVVVETTNPKKHSKERMTQKKQGSN